MLKKTLTDVLIDAIIENKELNENFLAYHSGNAIIKKFDKSKINKGAGNSYGWGVYFSINPRTNIGYITRYSNIEKYYQNKYLIKLDFDKNLVDISKTAPDNRHNI